MKIIIQSISKLICVIGLVAISVTSQAQVLDLESTTEGALLPRMTTAQRTAITTASTSEIVYDTDTKSFWYWENMQWNEIGAGGTSAPAATFFDCGVGISGDTIRNTHPAVRDTITLTSTDVITAETHVSICLDVDHTYVGDLNVNLISPNTTSTIGLSLTNGAGGDNFKGTCFAATAKNTIALFSDAPFTGVYLPEEPLSALVGQTIAGDWTLEIADVNSGDDGIFNNWEINFTNSFSLIAQKALEATTATAAITADKALSATILSDDDNDTKIQVEDSTDEDIIRFDIGGGESLALTKNAGGHLVIEPKNSFFNTIIGDNAASNLISSGQTTTIVGAGAGQNMTSSAENTLVGTGAGQNLINTNGNTFIGRWAGRDNTGTANTFLGNYAGLNSTSSNSVFIGRNAGQNENNNARLYIDNSNTSTPLIYGEFDSNKLSINTNQTPGTFQITDPDTDRTSMYLLPKSQGSADDSSIFFGEDHNGTFGMEIEYDGDDNQLEIYGHNDGTVTGPHFLIKRDDGRVAIGNDFAAGFKLSVDGKVACEEVLVDMNADWPDYVFESDYNLRSLEEVQQHIDEKGHLPNVPSAQEVADQGIEVGEMNRILMEKVEELTLYIIEQNKQISDLSYRLSKVEKN
jgi:subtilisin-like proprotein convertase family protein